MQIYCNKRKRLHKKRVQLPGDWLGTPTWPSFHCFGTPIWPPWRHVKTLYRHPLRKKVVQRSWHFLSKIICRDITEDLKAVLMLLFCRWKVFMQIRRSPEQRNIFWSGLVKQLKKLRGKILWLQNSSTPLLVSYLIHWIYVFIVWGEFSCRKMKKHRLMLMINLC